MSHIQTNQQHARRIKHEDHRLYGEYSTRKWCTPESLRNLSKTNGIYGWRCRLESV
jgi:hypothetical protein